MKKNLTIKEKYDPEVNYWLNVQPGIKKLIKK